MSLNVLVDNSYISKLPLDLGGVNFYYHKCLDGQNFNITAIIEDTMGTDAVFTKSNGVLIYIPDND